MKSISPFIRATLVLTVFVLLIHTNVKPASAACGTTNLVLNKPAVASSTQSGLTPAAAVDGNTTVTRWGSDWSDPQWLQVDLGATQPICRVRLNWEAAFGKGYQVQTSNDAVNWTNVYSTTTGDGGVDDLTVTGSGRYVRMYGTVRATTWGYSLYEVEVYADSASPTATRTNTPTATRTSTITATSAVTNTPTRTNTAVPTATNTAQVPTNTPNATSCGTSNVALNKPATASSSENAATVASFAVDGSTGTRWSSTFSDPQWLYVDLLATMDICRVKLNWEAAYSKSYQIQVSNDAAMWTPIYTTTTSDGGIDDLTGLSGSGRYVRMFGSVRATQYGYSLWEFEVYNRVAGSTPVPTSTTPPTNTPVVSIPTNTPNGATSVPTPCNPVGTFPICFTNNTRGVFADSQVYIMFLGMPVSGEWYYLKADGTPVHINHLDASAANHLTKNGVNYANMAFTLAQAKTVPMPPRWEGGRVYISLGSPMYIPISNDDKGWGGPDLRNPNDPNADVNYDWYEFTYRYDVQPFVPFGGNTTQVDQFGFPMTARLLQASTGYDQTVGITLTHDQVFSQYSAAVAPAFRSLALANGTRIVAPRSSNDFSPIPPSTGAQMNYLQSTIDATWNYYTTNQFTLTRLGETFSGKVVNGVLQFTKNGAGSFVLNKPTSKDVFECSGALASAGMTTEALALGAEFCAAFNRGVAMNTANWYTPSAYYSTAMKNDYAMFFHSISIDRRSYGFAYDDINDQSSVKILGNNNPPSALIISVGW